MYDGKSDKTAVPNGGCRLFDLDLAAYLEGEERPGLLAHAGECPFCHSILADMEGIRLASSKLAMTDEPPARLWVNIRAALVAEGIIHQREAFWQRWLGDWRAAGGLHNPLTFAALGCLLVLGIGLVKVPRLPRTTAQVDLSDVSRATVALGSMETSYQVQALSFEPSMKETYQKSLDSLDGEIRECLNSVKQEPDNSLAREYLLAAYEQKAYVLESALNVDSR